MPLVLSEVKDEKEFGPICRMAYYAWKEPYNPQLKHFRPNIHDPEEAIEDNRVRSIKGWKTHPGRHQLKVVDTDSGEVVGAACWQVEEKPDPTPEHTVAEWHPEGSVEKEFAERFINGLWGFLAERVTRPHLDLLSIVVLPAYRRRGVGRMMMRWGTTKADELGIEIVISSLPFAREAYERCGFGTIEVIRPDVDVPKPSERWKELQEDDLSGFLMWRPVGHDYVEGKDKAPWLL
ncbi:hypothetical protein K469DRAFT_717608 [Zopfia rhizophila CBS 207.26]|uniref:N-acetyltransferase domain-containing protein n=1 Tax=Zopfia rhizophila CBS 207.26 TaxID=1314779 RepID=A0A6A6D574_9PEZI|nr:hypothetical protein K469DRAFT_707092 [Zopfia rhizophila CBS 207.26]KAF2179096.1 hypothetical protein K469DRAFT_717608 [Zopfia rhizophila CBS 207.26]